MRVGFIGLASYGEPVLHVGPLGTGQGVKLVNNTLFAAQIGLLHEAVRLGDRLGVDEQRLLDAIGHGSAGWRASSVPAGPSTRSSKWLASSSARTSPCYGKPRPNSAAISGFPTT
jgi:3-hydroxyisobutyrate dehydrogenase-like beta-hydroxyacid dehydrogenase